MKVKKHMCLLSVLLVTLLLLASCNDSNEIFSQSQTDMEKVQLNIGVSLPGASRSVARGFGDDSQEYYTFSDLYVAVFVEIEGVSYLDEFVKADASYTQWNDTDKCWTFRVSLSKTTDNRRLHIIANYPGLTMGFGEEGQLIGRLLAQGKNHDVYWNYCEVNKIDDTDDSDLQTKLQNIPLLRNYVKIVLNDARGEEEKSNFNLESYALYNVPTKGTVAPYNPSGTNIFPNFVNADGQCQSYTYLLETERYEGNEPFDDGTLISTDIRSIEWIDVEHGEIPPIYTYERSNSAASNPTCMLIKGKYIDGSNEIETYYKLDFVYNDGGTKVYYNLLRNFVYTMNLNRVRGEGYASVEEAIKQPASNNIGGDAVAKNYTNISDGTNHLYVSTTYMMFTNSNTAFLYYKYMEGATKQNAQVTITVRDGNVLNSEPVCSVSDETEGLYKGWRKVTLQPGTVSAVSQSQTLVFAAGGLQREVELVLRQPYSFRSVQTPDVMEAGTQKKLDVVIKLPDGIAPSLFPLRLFISSEDNTIYPDYGTNMPAEAQNGKYGFIKEVSLDDYNRSTDKVFSCTFLTNCHLSATTVYVDNEYFKRGSDSFKITTIEIPSSQKVSFENYGNRLPRKIYEGGTESVSIRLNDDILGTKVTVGRDNLVQSVTLQYEDGFKASDELTFTFEDQYWSNGIWGFGAAWQAADTYTATCSVEELLSGSVTLHFER